MFDFSKTSNAKRLLEFATLLKQLSERIGFRVSSRGWCYILEQNGAITKDQFDKVETWVNRCRRRGVLPIDFVAEEDARKFKGIETPADISPVADLLGWIEAIESAANHYAVDWWVGEKYYVQMVVEKIDLVTLFRPVCAKYHIPIANSKGWSSMLQRAEYARRFHEAEEKVSSVFYSTVGIMIPMDCASLNSYERTSAICETSNGRMGRKDMIPV